MLTASYGWADILKDDITDTTLKKLIYIQAPTATIDSSSIAIEYTNKGISAWHTFKFTLSIDSMAG